MRYKAGDKIQIRKNLDWQKSIRSCVNDHLNKVKNRTVTIKEAVKEQNFGSVSYYNFYRIEEFEGYVFRDKDIVDKNPVNKRPEVTRFQLMDITK